MILEGTSRHFENGQRASKTKRLIGPLVHVNRGTITPGCRLRSRGTRLNSESTESWPTADVGHDRGARDYSFGSKTVSMTWITPLPHSMSALITLALFTFTPFDASIAISSPSTVLADFSLTTSAAKTLPGTTW